jgi:hypothetical protein
VQFKSSGRGSIRYSTTQKEFDGNTVLTIPAFDLPATCLVTIDGARSVFQVFGSGTVECNNSGGAVACTPSSVQ